jgi:hypothetical protein
MTTVVRELLGIDEWGMILRWYTWIHNYMSYVDTRANQVRFETIRRSEE